MLVPRTSAALVRTVAAVVVAVLLVVQLGGHALHGSRASSSLPVVTASQPAVAPSTGDAGEDTPCSIQTPSPPQVAPPNPPNPPAVAPVELAVTVTELRIAPGGYGLAPAPPPLRDVLGGICVLRV